MNNANWFEWQEYNKIGAKGYAISDLMHLLMGLDGASISQAILLWIHLTYYWISLISIVYLLFVCFV